MTMRGDDIQELAESIQISTLEFKNTILKLVRKYILETDDNQLKTVLLYILKFYREYFIEKEILVMEKQIVILNQS